MANEKSKNIETIVNQLKEINEEILEAYSIIKNEKFIKAYAEGYNVAKIVEMNNDVPHFDERKNVFKFRCIDADGRSGELTKYIEEAGRYTYWNRKFGFPFSSDIFKMKIYEKNGGIVERIKVHNKHFANTFFSRKFWEMDSFYNYITKLKNEELKESFVDFFSEIKNYMYKAYNDWKVEPFTKFFANTNDYVNKEYDKVKSSSQIEYEENRETAKNIKAAYDNIRDSIEKNMNNFKSSNQKK